LANFLWQALYFQEKQNDAPPIPGKYKRNAIFAAWVFNIINNSRDKVCRAPDPLLASRVQSQRSQKTVVKTEEIPPFEAVFE
jgi:hypothetical protein